MSGMRDILCIASGQAFLSTPYSCLFHQGIFSPISRMDTIGENSVSQISFTVTRNMHGWLSHVDFCSFELVFFYWCLCCCTSAFSHKGLSKPAGLLVVWAIAIVEANAAMKQLQSQDITKKWGTNTKLDDRMKAKLGKYSSSEMSVEIERQHMWTCTLHQLSSKSLAWQS